MNNDQLKLKKENRDALKEICGRRIGEAYYYGKGARSLTQIEKEEAADMADELREELVKNFNIQI